MSVAKESPEMSVAKGVPGANGPAAGEKIILPRGGPELWTTLQKYWAGERRLRWKQLAMLHLQCHCGWTESKIGLAFGQHRGRVSRLIRSAKEQLARLFVPEPEPPVQQLDDDFDD